MSVTFPRVDVDTGPSWNAGEQDATVGINRPLKIAIDVRCLGREVSAGATRFTRSITAALANRPGVQVVGFSDTPVSDLPVKVVRFKARRAVSGEQLHLPRAVARWSADVLLSPANRGLPLVTHVPGVLVLHDTVEWDGRIAGVRRGRAAIHFAYSSVSSLATAVKIVVPSEHSAAQSVRQLRIEEDRLAVVPYAADAKFFLNPSQEAVREVRRRFDVLPGAILYIGGAHPKKDLMTLFRAFARLPRSQASQLLIAGDVAGRKGELLHRAEELRIRDRIKLAGFVEEDALPALFRSAELFVFPARHEGFGLPVIEAMASGTATVVARAGALPEVGGRTTAYFEPGDHDDLAQTMAALLVDDRKRGALAAAAQERAARFSWDASASMLEAVLREAAATPLLRRARTGLAGFRHARLWALQQ